MWTDRIQGLGAAKDAVRMARIAKFYERLPKGAAPEQAPSGLLGRYQARYFGKNPSAARKSQLLFSGRSRQDAVPGTAIWSSTGWTKS